MKRILGLDLGTNSIGWSLIENDFDNKEGEIKGIGSRIIPMSQDVLGKFDGGVSISQTAERTGYRGVRRLYQRDNLRRERLHRVLNTLDFLPEHYANEIDFKKHFGQFKKGKEPKLNYRKNTDGKYEFIFMDSFKEMVKEFEAKEQSIKIPYDWALYYLRKKALTQKISKEELAWVILNFNQKRGYYQLRGEELKDDKSILEKFYSLVVKRVEETGDKNAKGTWYNVVLENDWIYRRQSKESLNSWVGKSKDFIVTTQLEKDGTTKLDKEGNVKRSFRAPKEDDWSLIKKKTEQELESYINKDYKNKSVGSFIFKTLLQNPTQKIRGKLIKTIERKYYRKELEQILKTQIQLHDELQNRDLYQACVNELYPRNEAHQNNIKEKDFEYLFIQDIIFYQRPLKSKKSTIANCQFETRSFIDQETKEKKTIGLKGISKSHPLFQEFRLLQWFKFLKIYKKEDEKGNLIDKEVTDELLPDMKCRENLLVFLKSKKEVEQKHVLEYFSKKGLIPKQKKNVFTHRWNYVEDKKYLCYETIASFESRLKKVDTYSSDDFKSYDESAEFHLHLWHIIYSVKDKNEFKTALGTFALKHKLDKDSFVAAFEKYPPFDNNYGAFSEKALKKLVPLMRFGKSWKEKKIPEKVKTKIDHLLTGEVDENIQLRVRELLVKHNHTLNSIEDFNGLPLHLASYIVYDRHSESGDIQNWKIPIDIDKYLHEFKQHSLRNPIVEQVVTETLRTVRDIWKYYGNGKENFFHEIHIELGREMKNPANIRERISKKNTENENTNARIKAILQELMNDGIEARPYSPNHQEILKIYEEGVYQNPNADFLQMSEDDIEKIRKNSSPSPKDIQRYKLWLEQGYFSPYTGKPIPLSKLFSKSYQIEHIIPQSRYFDNSLSNKVICESEVNQLKDNQTGVEFVKNHGGQIEAGYKIYTLDQYESHCNKYFKKNKTKLKKLLSEEIPEGFIERQLNDSRYISKLIKGLLSNIVREKGEQEATSKNVVPVTGAITSKLKRDWGLNDKWNELVAPRFKRLNELTNSNDFGYWDKKINAFRTQVPDEIVKGFNKKRIDHRHHALDALVIACCTKDHTNYITSLNTNRNNYKLVNKLRETEEIEIKGKKRNVAKAYHKPWKGFTIEAKEKLEKTIISFKKNNRVINKTNNKTWQWDKDGSKKVLVPQTKGNNWAIRKPMHKETVSGLVNLKRKRKSTVALNVGIDNWELLVDKTIKHKIKSAFELFDNNAQKVKSHFKKNPIVIDDEEIKKVELYEMIRATATRTELTNKFTRKQLESITDTGIQKILENHIKNYLETDDKGKRVERFDLAFNAEGVEELNKNIKELNNGKNHQPIKKVRIYEAGSKFSISENKESAKSTKYVEAAKGTNLFFAIYWDEEKQKRVYETIPLNLVIEHQKQVAHLPKTERTEIPINVEKGNFLFSLSPNDLAYVPTDYEIDNPSLVNFDKLSKEQVQRVYKMVSSTGNRLYGVPNEVAKSIKNKFEFTSLNKLEFDFNKNSIKERCWKLKVDRLGNIIQCLKVIKQ